MGMRARRPAPQMQGPKMKSRQAQQTSGAVLSGRCHILRSPGALQTAHQPVQQARPPATTSYGGACSPGVPGEGGAARRGRCGDDTGAAAGGAGRGARADSRRRRATASVCATSRRSSPAPVAAVPQGDAGVQLSEEERGAAAVSAACRRLGAGVHLLRNLAGTPCHLILCQPTTPPNCYPF